MAEDNNYLDMAQDFDIVYSQVENESAITAWQYAMEQVADHWSSYNE